MTIKDRILLFAASLNLAKKDFFYITGQSASNYKGNAMKSDIGSDKIVKILTKYPQLSAEWLLTGEGEMLRQPAITTEIKSLSNLKSVERNYENQTVYLYDLEASAGLKAMFDDRSNNIIDTIRIPNLPKCDGAMYVVGDSMYPLLKSGDIILYKQIQALEENLCYGEMYILSYKMDDEYYIVCKYIKKSEKGFPFITLASQNPHHADRDIDFRRVDALAMVKAMIRINSMS